MGVTKESDMTQQLNNNTRQNSDKSHDHEGYKDEPRNRELMLLNCGVGEDSSESLGQQGD